MDKTLIIIPTYNEKDNIKSLVDEIIRFKPNIQILIIDDNSPDGTAQIAFKLSQQYPFVNVIKREGKFGLGSAYIEGFRYALARKDIDYIFQMDADFSHQPRYILDFLKQIQYADLVIGSRYVQGGAIASWPLHRLALSYLANYFSRSLLALKIKDTTSGFKCFRRKVIESLDLEKIKSNGYAFQIVINFISKEKGFIIKELPIIFTDRWEGSSKMNLGIVLEAVFMVVRLFLKRVKLKFY